MATPLRITLARNLAALMERRPDLDTQQKVAARAKIGQTTIGRVLRAEAAATVDLIDKLAKAFNVSPDSLVKDGVGQAVNGLNIPAIMQPDAVQTIQDFIDFTITRMASNRPAALYSTEVAQGGDEAILDAAASRTATPEVLQFDSATRQRPGRPRRRF
jgi:transcriptional regulator with XRE-family HTH domain